MAARTDHLLRELNIWFGFENHLTIFSPPAAIYRYTVYSRAVSPSYHISIIYNRQRHKIYQAYLRAGALYCTTCRLRKPVMMVVIAVTVMCQSRHDGGHS